MNYTSTSKSLEHGGLISNFSVINFIIWESLKYALNMK